MSHALNAWVNANPKIEIPEALNGLLKTAADVWLREITELHRNPKIRQDYLPGNRHPGGEILTIHCGTIRASKPLLADGRIYAIDNSKVGLEFPNQDKSLIHVDGLAKTNEFNTLLFDDPKATNLPTEFKAKYFQWKEDLSKNLPVMQTLLTWHQACGVAIQQPQAPVKFPSS
jgi:hypothetical protein